MECPKCHTIVDDNQAVCPKCRKVLLLECPNCHSLSESSVCTKCGYSILVKCNKCSKINHIKDEFCTKCKFPIKTSLAYQECESDEFAALTVSYGSLKTIRRMLKSQELYTKFFLKLKNLLFAQLKGVDCKVITYNDTFVINFNRELSLATSSNKAVRLALKIANAFVALNTNIMDELNVPLNLNLTIAKKNADELQDLITYSSSVKSLSIKKNDKKYLKGLSIILDQYVWDYVNKEYKTDSLYSQECNGKTIMFYEVIPDSYIMPPEEASDSQSLSIQPVEIKKNIEDVDDKNMYAFKVFDINARCSFIDVPSCDLLDKLANLNFDTNGKIVALRSQEKNAIKIKSIVDFYKKEDFNVVSVCCTEKMNYRPWGFFDELISSLYGLAFNKSAVSKVKISGDILTRFSALFDLFVKKPVKAMSPEDARFAYMEECSKFLSSLSKTVIIVDGFENLDDTSIQTLELYFDKFKSVVPNFVFITNEKISVHSKIKGLLRTNCYTEFTLRNSTMDMCLATLKTDATDFIQSFYFEKIRENFRGSYLYFQNAIEYLKESGILTEFEGKLLIKSKKSVIIPKDLKGLYKCRIKTLSQNVDLSLILAYMGLLAQRVDFATFEALEIKDLDKNIKKICDLGLGFVVDDILILDNYNLIAPVIQASLKKEIETYLVKNIVAKVGKTVDDTNLVSLMGLLGAYKEEYLTLWKNAQFAIKTGDYDAYLKNCLGFLSIVEHIEDANLTAEQLEENKKEVFNNILMFLYAYSPAKIYYIENLLLMDAINEGDDERIVKLSNLMLQGALISANYKDALGLLHNILVRMKNATLIVDGAVNTKFLLLSLVNIEILYNIGNFKECVEVAEDILSVLKYDMLDKIKPASFSINLFINHILETFRLVALAKLYILDNDLEEFFDKVNSALNAELQEKDCILAVRDYLSGKEYSINDIEKASASSKAVFLILQEFSVLNDDYKRFAQNIYQAKVLADDIHQEELKLFCDLLIGYAYWKLGITQKAEAIYQDVLATSEKSAMFNILMFVKYLLAKLKFEAKKAEEALIIVNDALDAIQKQENHAKILYVLHEKLYIEIAESTNLTPIDVEVENQKLELYSTSLKRLLS